MKDHRLLCVVSSPRFSGPHWACSCGRSNYCVSTRATAKTAHERHIAHVKAREELTAALLRWEGEPAQLFLDVENVADWAERDQDEMRQGPDADDEREARNNMKIVRELARAFRALLVLDGWGPVKLTKAA